MTNHIQERMEALEREVARLRLTLSYRICNCKGINKDLEQGIVRKAHHHAHCAFAVAVYESAEVMLDEEGQGTA